MGRTERGPAVPARTGRPDRVVASGGADFRSGAADLVWPRTPSRCRAGIGAGVGVVAAVYRGSVQLHGRHLSPLLHRCAGASHRGADRHRRHDLLAAAGTVVGAVGNGGGQRGDGGDRLLRVAAYAALLPVAALAAGGRGGGGGGLGAAGPGGPGPIAARRTRWCWARRRCWLWVHRWSTPRRRWPAATLAPCRRPDRPPTSSARIWPPRTCIRHTRAVGLARW